MEGSDDEDGRKPAARPTAGASPQKEDGLMPHEECTVALPVSGELEFLVTHWLSGYFCCGEHEKSGATEEQRAALDVIQNAAASLASAFTSLGAFGSSAKPSLGLGTRTSMHNATSQSKSAYQHATYADMKRTWSSCGTDHLSLLMKSTQSVSALVDATVKLTAPENHVQASAEILLNTARNNTSGGRTLQDAIVITEGTAIGANSDVVQESTAAFSALQAPLLLQRRAYGECETDAVLGFASNYPSLTLGSSVAELTAAAATSMRHYLETRAKCHDEATQICSLKRSLQFQQETLVKMDLQRSEVLTLNRRLNGDDGGADATGFLGQLDEIKAAELNCQRVIAQLLRQLPFLEQTHEMNSRELVASRQQSSENFMRTKLTVQKFSDPLVRSQRPTILNNRILLNICNRQRGIDRYLERGIPRAMGRIRSGGDTIENRKALLYNRFSHAATINTHLLYPVYCLRFDRTGRYFITGADDYLVKVFCVGGSAVVKKNGRMDPAAYSRGAVLVCTLKGHAGVINDIGVSSDNSFLATASEDGDCRVWGLKDGCPVAILRGHNGGANMVSWSMLTPYRLVTAGADGLARTWDVREACLKRYSNLIGKRPEYQLRFNGKDFSLCDDKGSGQAVLQDQQNPKESVPIPPLPAREDVSPVPVPPLPVRENMSPRGDAAISVFEPPNAPLPPPPPAGAVNLVGNGNAEEEVAGRFVANDAIDEGVKLVSKLQHGATLDERLGGPGTRARRSAVKVICVARCPFGGHFATGSDDGICRIWREEDNAVVERIDSLFDRTSMANTTGRAVCSGPTKNGSADRLLFSLKGHLSAITDLQYSKRGDRILTASQKDGVVRIWSWSTDPAATILPPPPTEHENGPIRSISHILIKLTNPSTAVPSGEVRQGPRARPNRSHNATIACDVAVWIHDDTKIVTSQSELAKQSGNEIITGSQYLFLWDSINGHCLLGIPGAHTMACPVVIPHPVVSSIICSAGADGVVKLWDWETGKCFFSHRNTADFGPIEPSERGNSFGYLDGDFSPDGTILVLTDDSGRVTVLDSSVVRGNAGVSSAVDCPDWMKEQYFSNDYYDLFYDASGYCVERGSERPPHLAPRGARCSHSGTAFSGHVDETFKRLGGPIPTDEKVARWERKGIRENAHRMSMIRIAIKGNLVRQYDPTTTTLVQRSGILMVLPKASTIPTPAPTDTPDASRSRAGSMSGSTNRLSSNFRWRDFNDLDLGDEEQDHETDDEDFELNESARNGTRRSIEDSDSEELEMEDEDEMEPSRTSSRQRRRTSADEDDNDSGDEFDEFVSTNNAPTGPFVADYDAHYFRMPTRDHGNNVCRLWLRRNESSSSFGGRKKYTPQVGDAVVYIPRAHHDTLAEFPGVQTPPWQQWPEDAAWPTVRCCVRSIRYRFPYKDYKTSVVAKLMLEVTGIPQLSTHQSFGWPSPSFTSPAKCHVFELSLFDNNGDDYIIPLGLYVSRLRQLEIALSDPNRDVQVEAFYADSRDAAAEDADYISFPGRVVRYSDTDDATGNHPSLFGSGFRSLGIVWDQENDDDPDQVSPWDVSVHSRDSHVEAPERLKLDEDEKRRVRDALNSIGSLASVDEFFFFPVDLAKYSDYASRVEVSMDLTFMKNRLEADYYSTKFSAVADVQLIYSNCKKYNGDADELSVLAAAMLGKFEELVLSEEERQIFHEYDTPVAGIATTTAALPETLPNPESRSSAVQRRSQRRPAVRSPLESIPSPLVIARPQSRSTGRSTRPANRQNNLRQGRVRQTRSVLEAVAPEPVRTLEQLSSGRGQSTRGRATRSSTTFARASVSSSYQSGLLLNEQIRDIPRRAARGSLRNSVYAEVASDVDEIEVVQQAASTRGCRRSVLREGQTNRADRVVNDHGRMPLRRTAAEARSSLSELAESDKDSASGSGRRYSKRRQKSADVANARGRKRSSNNSPSPSSESFSEADTGAFAPQNRSSANVGVANDSGFEKEQGTAIKRVSSHRASNRINSTRSRRSSRISAPDHDAEVDEPVPRTPRSLLPEATDGESSFDEPQSDDGSDFEDGDNDLGASDSDVDMSVQSRGSNSVAVATPPARSRPSRSRSTKLGNRSSPVEEKRKSPRSRGLGDVVEFSRTSRGRAAQVPDTYCDPSSSEFGSDAPSDPPSVARRSQKKPLAKKRKFTSTAVLRKKFKAEFKDEPAVACKLEKWPGISIKHISEVTMGVLEHLRNLDELDIFAIPVAEAYPDAADSYLERITHPMDFRTIEEERMLYYQSISELQNDLIQIFANCMEYNEPGSPLYDTASSMMGLLEDTLRQVCESLGVRLLHH